MNKSAQLLFCFALLALTSSCGNNWSHSGVKETIARGDIIRAALVQYRNENGSFPGRLELLVPKYLPVIPLPTVGRRVWVYVSYVNGKSYQIRVSVSEDSEPQLLNDERSGDWSFDDK